MKSDSGARLEYLAEMRELLWPASAGGSSGGTAARRTRTMRVLPTADRPRLFAPVTPRRSSASAVLRYVAQQPPLSRARGLVVAAAVGAGWHERGAPIQVLDAGWHERGAPIQMLDADEAASTDADEAASIDEHLGVVLGEPVVTSLALTPTRANRKPVLQVFDARGRTIAFAKVAVSPLSTTLVRTEAAALTEVAGHDTPHLRVPDVLDCRDWHGMTVLVTSVLPAFSTGVRRARLLNQAMLEISRIPGRHASHGVDGYLGELSARADAAAPVLGDDVHSMWQERFEPAAQTARRLGLPVGAWHGDWTPWNCVATRAVIAAWDWERFSGAGLTGFDRLHYTLHRDAITATRGFAAAAPALLARAPQLLGPWSLPADQSRAVAALYLLDISLRYAADGQRTARGAGAIDVWALPALAGAEPSYR